MLEEILEGVSEEPTANPLTESTEFEREGRDNRLTTKYGVYRFRAPPSPQTEVESKK